MKPLWLPSLIALCCALSGAAWAEKADRDRPMNIEADMLRHDDVRQHSVFSGNVLLTKGSIVARAQSMEVRQDAEGYQSGTMLGSGPNPAFFRQKRDGADEWIEGESARIEYDGRADTVRFVGQATLRRLRGATLADEIRGAVIVYENLSDTFRVDGALATGPASGASARVRVMLTPKPQSANATPQAPAALRPSSSLAPGAH